MGIKLMIYRGQGSASNQLTHTGTCSVKIEHLRELSLLFAGKFKEPNIPWAKLKAKEILYKDIMKGVVPAESEYDDNTSTMELKKIHSMHPEYSEYDYSNFSHRLSSLRKINKK